MNANPGNTSECNARHPRLTRAFAERWGIPHEVEGEGESEQVWVPYWALAAFETLRGAGAFADPELFFATLADPETRAAFVTAHRAGVGPIALYHLVEARFPETP